MRTIEAVVVKGVVVEPEHILHENGVREVVGDDGVSRFYGRGKPQVHPEGARRVTSNTVGESMTKQSEATLAGYHVNDIAAMVKRCQAGIPVKGASAAPRYIDNTVLPDMQASLDRVAYLNNTFSLLDSGIRRQFQNDPRVMLDWLSDSRNTAEAVRLGLLAPQEPSPVVAEPPQAAPEAPGGASQG